MTKKEFFKNRPSFKVLDGKKDLVGIEIGVLGGENAFNILTHLSIKILYLIDPYLFYDNMKGHGVIENNNVAEHFKKQAYDLLANFNDKIIWIYDFSENAHSSANNMDFVYIDGNHRYKYIKKDIELYYPKIKDGGIIAGHDFKAGEIGVCRAVEEFCKCSDNKLSKSNWDWWFIRKTT